MMCAEFYREKCFMSLKCGKTYFCRSNIHSSIYPDVNSHYFVLLLFGICKNLTLNNNNNNNKTQGKCFHTAFLCHKGLCRLSLKLHIYVLYLALKNESQDWFKAKESFYFRLTGMVMSK